MAEEEEVLEATASTKRSNETPQENTKKKANKSVPQQSDNNDTIPVLPRELIVEILYRLPVKALIKFRCVSKSFKTLISDAQFIKIHLSYLSKIKKPSIHQRIVLNYGAPLLTSLKSCSLLSIFDSSQTDAIEFDGYSLNNRFRFHWVFGSCDGLLCLAMEQNFVTLLNPSTRVYNELPHLGFGKKLGGYTVFGFGYDAETDDYKVVAVFSFPNRNANTSIGYESAVKVLALRTNRWRKIGSFEYGVPYDVSGKYVDGSLNWPVMCERDSRVICIIVSFDLGKETYKEVMQPDYGRTTGYARTLGVLDGCLSVMCDYETVSADLWVMKEYGVKESWIKLVSIPYLYDAGAFVYSVPFCIAENGEILMEFKHSFVIYNPRDGTFRYPATHGSHIWMEAEIYIESLVSPRVEI